MISITNIAKMTIVIVASTIPIACFSQSKIKPNEAYVESRCLDNLGSIFPVEDIDEVVITNNYGRHKLSANELSFLKQQLKAAKFSGGLMVKPGHIGVSMKLNKKSTARPGFVYASTGSIHFDGATDRNNREFSGTYYLPSALNFDNYR